mgnify:CR=1 FL=1
MTTKNNDTIYSYWAAETMDPDSKIENMTIGQLNNMFDRTNTNVKKVAGDTIDRVDVAEASDKKGGTISLMRRGTYNSTTGLYENSVAVAGALKITSSGGENGNDDDVAINISQADGKGKYEKKFSIKAGSVVKANSDGENKGELQSITINGYKYTIPLKAAQTHFYSVNSTDEKAGNYNNDGAKGKNSLAAGVGAQANGSDSVAIGTNATIQKGGNNSVAIGMNAKAQNDALAVGEKASAGNTGIAIGMKANAGYGQNMALGYYASVADGVSNSTALGYGSQVTKRDILKSDGNDGVISVGKAVGQSGEKGLTRRIINVKAGVNDTDAVNVSQLNQSISDAAYTDGDGIAIKDKKISVNKGNGLEFTQDGALQVKAADQNLTVNENGIGLNNVITIGTAGQGAHPITIDGTKGEISGLSNTTWDKNKDYSTSTKAATEAQIQSAVNAAKDDVKASDVDTHVEAGSYGVDSKHQVSMDIVDKTGKATGDKVTITDVAKASEVGDVSKLADGVKNTDGTATTVVNAVNNVNTKVDKVDKKVGDLDYSSTNYVAKNDSTTTAIGKLDAAIKNASSVANNITGGSNIDVTNVTDNKGNVTGHKVALKDDISLNSVTAKNVTTDNLKVNDSATIGKVSINKNGKGTVNGLTNTTWDAKNITSGQAATEDQLKAATKNAVNYDGDDSKTITLRENTTIKNVADTTIEQGSKNAVNAGTVYNETRVAKDGTFVKQSNTAGENLSALDNQVTANTESIYHMNGRISDLDNRVNKVGAGAAALAALHPLDFDPDAKWDFAAGYGNYRGANAAAVGAYYRPNEDTMFSVGGTFGNGENMVNAGVSFKLGSGSSHVSTSRVAMAKEIKELRGELEAMKSAMLDANAGKKIDTSKLQLFPDVPQNHWAYEYVAQLAGNGMIEGYPDGNFAGDRPMTRYEFAAILYRAMTKGAVLSDKILSEFSHELEYFTVDTIAKDKAGNPTIQRVRTVKENKNK